MNEYKLILVQHKVFDHCTNFGKDSFRTKFNALNSNLCLPSGFRRPISELSS